jgi:hypothetical protein
VVLAAAAGQPAVVSGCVEAETVAETRARLPFLADRRPALYERLRAAPAAPGRPG